MAEQKALPMHARDWFKRRQEEVDAEMRSISRQKTDDPQKQAAYSRLTEVLRMLVDLDTELKTNPLLTVERQGHINRSIDLCVQTKIGGVAYMDRRLGILRSLETYGK